MKLILKGHQLLDKLGDGFLDTHNFEIEFDFSYGQYVICTIDGKPNYHIKRKDLLAVLRLLQETENASD